jgi:hypothetical protein
VTNFATSNDGERFEVSLACVNECAAGAQARLYKAGLWIKLESLDKADIHYRTSHGMNVIMAYDLDFQRTKIDLSAFSNPTFDFQATAFVSSSGSTQVQLVTAATADFGPSALTAITGSQLDFIDTNKTLLKTAAPITLTTGDRFLPQITPGTGTMTLIDTGIIVHTQR